FSPSKNQRFLLTLLQHMVSDGKDAYVVFVGDGVLLKEVAQQAERMGLSHRVRFLGVREDIPRLMKSFDVFVFPSLFEGFGMVAVEAQCAGTPCVVSDAVPKTTDMGLGLVQFISLQEDTSAWCRKIEKAWSAY